MKKRMKFLTMAMLAACAVLVLGGCDLEDEEEQGNGTVQSGRDDGTQSGDDTWTVCWYLCGSDLESDYGAATDDFEEMLAASLPENVKVVVETGGASCWYNDTVEADRLQRFCYSSEGLELVDEQPLDNMGDGDTLADFLAFCEKNYPADHRAVVFWNHGGGSVGGVAYDELYDYDSLSLNEIYAAFNQVYPLSAENPPIDLIGFDACLMSTIDTAYMAADIARYMVASEEAEPGNGWDHTGWLEALGDNPGMDGAELGKVICDTYAAGCEDYGTEDEMTLSVVDLGKALALVEAYESAGAEALGYACENPRFIAEFARSAEASENYGGNSRSTGYSNMVDLGDLVRNSRELLPDSGDAVLKALEDCVVYRVNGSYRERATGISCYYSYDGDIDSYLAFSQVTPSPSFDYFYRYSLGMDLPQEAQEYLGGSGQTIGNLLQVPTVQDIHLDDFELYLDNDGSAVLDLGTDTAALLKTVWVQLAYVDYDEDIVVMLGSDANVVGDWDSGVFRDNFWGTWGAIDGNLCYMDVTYEGDDYNLYAVPVLLNGEEMTLRVVYDYKEESYRILGARRGLEDNGMSDRNLIQLKPGDKITTLHYGSSVSGDDDFVQVEVDSFTVSADTAFEDMDMGDGNFVLMFDMVDAQNNSYLSAPVFFTVKDGEIYPELE